MVVPRGTQPAALEGPAAPDQNPIGPPDLTRLEHSRAENSDQCLPADHHPPLLVGECPWSPFPIGEAGYAGFSGLEPCREDGLVKDSLHLGNRPGLRDRVGKGESPGRSDLPRGDRSENGEIGSVPFNPMAGAGSREQYRPASPWVFCHRNAERILTAKAGFNHAVALAGLGDVHP